MLVAKTAPGFMVASSLANTSSLTPISSNTASTTMSASAISLKSLTGVMRESALSIAVCGIEPRETLVA